MVNNTTHRDSNEEHHIRQPSDLAVLRIRTLGVEDDWQSG